MPITSEIEFTRQDDVHRQTLTQMDFEAICDKVDNGYDATIINTFTDEVTLADMIESTQQSVELFNAVQQKIDVLAIMRQDSIIKMRVQDITNTPTILAFASNKWRGTTVAVIEGKNTAKFFLNIANHLIKHAGFITADSVEQAYSYIEKQRKARAE